MAQHESAFHESPFPRELIQQLREFGTATIGEASDGVGIVCGGIKPITSARYLSGTAVTVFCRPGDNLAIHRAIYVAEPGDVLVVTTGGYTEAGVWGEIMSIAAKERGINGLVTDGAVRDVDAIDRLEFPVFARAICIRGTRKDNPGEVNQPICIGGVRVQQGDVVVGDSDGIVIVPRRAAGEVSDRCRLRQEKEAIIKGRLREGRSTLELYGFETKISTFQEAG